MSHEHDRPDALPAADSEASPPAGTPPARLWDLPLRLFHWSLVALVVTAFVTVDVGGNWLTWHMRTGYAVLTLLLFRVLWGLAGSHTARFAQFVHGPAATLAYARALAAGKNPPHDGHNPLGAWSVLALLGALLLQAGTGLFTHDDEGNSGPLARFVSDVAGERLTSIHHLNEKVLYLLVALHLAAIAYYRFVKGRNLVVAMVSGDEPGRTAPATADDVAVRVRALILAAVAAALVTYVVNL